MIAWLDSRIFNGLFHSKRAANLAFRARLAMHFVGTIVSEQTTPTAGFTKRRRFAKGGTFNYRDSTSRKTHGR